MIDNQVHHFDNHVVEFKGFRDACHPPCREPPVRDPQRRPDHTCLADTGGRWTGSVARRYATWRHGPLHTFDAEQVWTIVDGSATVELKGEKLIVVPGDTVVMPAAAPRRVYAAPEAGFAAIVAATPGACASAPDGTGKTVPAWTV
ncbi:AraC family ligand binding domain-containing protein [Streptomyces sp. NPDC050610]|uniref:cupin domain-containing protein n=1 Tax=Streptomyces sp. NPDC050610 TaxID=3157097 RepID=UPI0034380FFA